jgi:hypothetical protein
MRDTLEKIRYMPDAWDGIELREYLAYQFENQSVLSRRPLPDKKRLRTFQNIIATRFGL